MTMILVVGTWSRPLRPTRVPVTWFLAQNLYTNTALVTVLRLMGLLMFHRRSQDFVWGCNFLPNKLTTFLVVALKDRLNTPPNLSHQAKTILKIDSCSGWGCTSCPGGAFTHFSFNLGLKKFFTALGEVQVHPLQPLATPMWYSFTTLDSDTGVVMMMSGNSDHDVREFRSLVIDIVLATDMSFHFQQIKIMRSLLSMPEK